MKKRNVHKLHPYFDRNGERITYLELVLGMLRCGPFLELDAPVLGMSRLQLTNAVTRLRTLGYKIEMRRMALVSMRGWKSTPYYVLQADVLICGKAWNSLLESHAIAV